MIDTSAIQPGSVLRYNDGRSGHNVTAEVLSVTPSAMVVQFEDRADTTTIRFTETAWMAHLSFEPVKGGAR